MTEKAAYESLEAVFWRLVGEGLTSDKIGHHPDYRAAMEREKPWPFYDDEGNPR